MFKKIAALTLCLMMALSMVSFAAAEDVPNVANTYFSYGYDVGFFIDYFIHFYDEIPGMGKVFYAGYALNQITYSGLYEILPEEREYACWPDRAALEAAGEGAEVPTGTAPYTVVFYDFEGNELDRCAMDETHLYNDMTVVTGIGGDHATYNLDTDPGNSRFSYAGEQAVPLLVLINPEDDTATLTLKVNGKYDDLVVLYVEGTFSMNEDQSVITLTPNDEADDGATVTKNADGSYTYVSTSGDEATLVEVKEAEVAYNFKGSIPVPGVEGAEADLICNLMDDGTMVIYADFMGNQMAIDQGTYEIDMTTYSFNFHFDTAGDIASEGYAADMALHYTAENVDPFGAIDQVLAFAPAD